MEKITVKKQLVVFLVFVIFLLTLLPTSAFADTGPKPSITVNISGVEGEILYADLLVPISTGYYDEYNADDDYLRKGYSAKTMRQDILDIFLAQREVGWHPVLAGGNNERIFGQLENNVESGKCVIDFTYRTPDECKLMIVTEGGEVFISNLFSPPFTALYALDLSSKALAKIPAGSDYDIYLGDGLELHLQKYLISFAITALLTILLEGLVLKFFSLFSKRNFLFFVLINLFTQALLYTILYIAQLSNVINVIHFAIFVFAEIAIVIIEAALYRLLFEKKNSTKRIVLYAIVANIASVVLGFAALYFVMYMQYATGTHFF